ncbi:MAG TPA: hypothetical protein ENI49_05395, partial [Thermoplasmatales archaeon]|nr:hypothetical protein [Thermoplasmatales archaeon]
MAKEEEIFLKNEHVEKILTPHPLSFMGLQSLWLFILLWGVLLWWVSIFSQYASIFSNQLIFLGTWWGVTVLAGVIASLVAIRWRILFFYVGILLLGTIILWQTGWINEIGTVKTFVLVYSIAISALSALSVFAYIKSHRYIIT